LLIRILEHAKLISKRNESVRSLIQKLVGNHLS